MDSGRALHGEVGYGKLTFSGPSRDLGFSRIDPYGHFGPGELFLEAVRRAYREPVADGGGPCPTRWVAGRATPRHGPLSSHGRTFEPLVLMSIRAPRDVGEEWQEEFQGRFDEMAARLARRARV